MGRAAVQPVSRRRDRRTCRGNRGTVPVQVTGHFLTTQRTTGVHGTDAREGTMQGSWKETMVGGSPEAERAEFDELARDIMRVQLKNAKTASAHGVPHGVDRAFHAKSTLATDRSELTFLDLAGDMRAGFAQPGRTYPSRGAARWGPTLAVRYLLRPAPDTVPAPGPPKDDPNYLSTEAARRLAQGDVRFELCIQRYLNEESTPIEDTAVEWTQRVSPAEPVAVLTLARGELSTVDALAAAQVIDMMAFNPWNTTDQFRPLGNLNRARKKVYDAGSAQPLGYRLETKPPGRD